MNESPDMDNLKSTGCDEHPGKEVFYQCSGCLKKLCPLCIFRKENLIFCSHCREPVRPLPGKSSWDYPASTYRDTLDADAPDPLTELAFHIANHVIVPTALIVMVGAFLFFLLDVRSVFFADTPALKQIGLCFGAAVVLIARYGKVYGERGKQVGYSVFLGLATFMAMNQFSTGRFNYFVNIAIIAAVWRFASGVTNNLHLVEIEKRKDQHRLYGVERIHHEAVERKFDLKPERFSLDRIRELAEQKEKERKKKKKSKTPDSYDAHGNPSAAVARLVVLAIILFALGEPFLLGGPPEVGERALAAVIVFLLAAGIVLAAGSVAGTYRHTIRSGGEATFSMVTTRILVSLLLMVVILAAAFTAPGIRYRGSGILQPDSGQKGGITEGKQEPMDEVEEELEQIKRGSDKRSREDREPAQGDKQKGISAPQSLFGFFAILGKLLILPVLAVFLVLFVYIMVKLSPNLGKLRLRFKNRLGKLLDKLKSLFRRQRQEKAGPGRLRRNPLELLPTIAKHSPRQAILLAYVCFLEFLEQAGYQRPGRHTPYEILYTLPRDFEYLSQPARELTDIYVAAAYSPVSPSAADREQALAILDRLRLMIDERRRRS